MPEMIRECKDAWRLRARLYTEAEGHPGDPNHVDVVQALVDLRSHFAGCEHCKNYIRSYIGRAVPVLEGAE